MSALKVFWTKDSFARFAFDSSDVGYFACDWGNTRIFTGFRVLDDSTRNAGLVD